MLTPYQEIFPHSDDPIMTVSLGQKSGKAAKGEYTFVECYCTDPGCDCRRVSIIVANRNSVKAVIDFGFDPDDDLAGPYLDDLHKQSAAAADLLEMFVYRINTDSVWLNGMYDRYRKVRQKVDGKKYRGKPFPKPGSVIRLAEEPPDMEEALREFSRFLDESGFDPFADDESIRIEPQVSVAELIDRLARDHTRTVATMDTWDRMVWANFLAEPNRAEELAELLPRLIPRNPREEERLLTALQVLRTVLDMVRQEIESRRPGSRELLAQIQYALAQHVYTRDGDLALCSQVTRTFLESRVEILPILREASQAQLVKLGESPGPSGIPSITPSLGTLLRKSGCQTHFEGFDNLLDLLLLIDPELQIGLFAELLDSRDSFVRDTAALMLFHPVREVREGVATVMASGTVRQITPETLRRLIISRNWFPAGIRKEIDEVITVARRSGVVCARLAPSPDCVIKASTIDGAGAQSFFIICGEKKRKTMANILWKQGHGVIDSFVGHPTKQEMASIFEGMPNLNLIEMAPEYLDSAVNNALAVGIAHENPPHLGLLQVAETLGCDRWKAEAVDPAAELAALRRELERASPYLLTPEERGKSLFASGMWSDYEPFADTWFEDDAAVDEVINRLNKGKRRASESRLEKAVLEEVLEPRRAVWLERLTFMTLWLRDAAEPPVPWQHMFHAAETLATGKPLKDHPFMMAVAEVSVAAALERAETTPARERLISIK
jgi:hypothetical protein